MREYELTVVYDLSVAENGGPEASVEQMTAAIQARGGTVLKVDHWGRRRLAYPINKAIDGDYVISRVELDPTAVTPLEAAFRIDERVYRHLVVRADELPAPPPPREPRRQPGEEAPAPAMAAPAPPPADAAVPTADEAPAEVTDAAVADALTANEAPAAPAAEAEAPVAAQAEEPAAEAEAAEAVTEAEATAAEATEAAAAPDSDEESAAAPA